MPVITRRVEVDASAATTFEYISTHTNVADWMFGVTAFTPVGPVNRAIGDRFDAELKLGPKVLRSTVEVTEWVDGSMFALTSVAGLQTASRWTVNPVDDAHCTADVEFGYDLPGGFSGKALAKVLEPFISQAVSQTDRTVRQRLGGRG
ncbi:MAG: SRPBCC family protein [Rhodococcus sp. (in: high G+C Gram-positive bacteria)]